MRGDRDIAGKREPGMLDSQAVLGQARHGGVPAKKPVTAVDFDSLSGISLRVSGSTFSDSIQVRLDVWLDVRYRDGRKSKWRSASFADQYQTIQAFIEAYGAYQAFRNAGQYPR